jgi:general secretion pathway protein G
MVYLLSVLVTSLVGVGQRTYEGLPINSEYDLYSRGPDGHTDMNLRTETARDDIVRARDGNFVGSAVDF